MERRELFGAVGAAAAGAWALGGASALADEKDHHHHLEKVNEDCLKACGECAKACNMMATHCLDKVVEGQGPMKVHAMAHALATDCAAFCVLSATMISRSSQLMEYACDACAKACRSCAAECEKAQNDEVMKDCAAKCRDCEKTCTEMVRSMKMGTTTRAS